VMNAEVRRRLGIADCRFAIADLSDRPDGRGGGQGFQIADLRLQIYRTGCTAGWSLDGDTGATKGAVA